MTYALTRYKSYQEYLDDESLSPEGNYRLLSTGELIEVVAEDDLNRRIAFRLLKALLFAVEDALSECICNGNKEVQVRPVGDRRVNRKPDILVLHPEHLAIAKQAVLPEMVPPLFVAEIVSRGGENSDNYKRDYSWKRQQYAELGIPEYWIVDPHREKITVLVLRDGTCTDRVYEESHLIVSKVFPTLSITVQNLLEDEWS